MADVTASPPLALPAPRRSAFARHLKAMLREPRVAIGGGFILLLLLVAIFAPFLAPKDPLEQDLMLGTLPPAGYAGAEPGYWLGTDDLGRDVLSRVLYGTRVALTVAFVAAGLAGLIGTALGLIAGWDGGRAGRGISPPPGISVGLPPGPPSVPLGALPGSRLPSRTAPPASIGWTRFCRVVRAETQAQASMDYVVAARTIGFSRLHILLREILPNVAPALIALVSLEMGIAVIVEAILSFVGLSVSSDTPTWGGMIAQGRQIVYQGWWVLVVPLTVLFATVLAFNQLGDGLRRALDPVMRR